MRIEKLKIDHVGPYWRQTLVGMILLVGIFIAQRGMTVDVRYQWALVHAIHPIVGQDSYHRAVVIETSDRRRVVRTEDILLRFAPGDYVCAARKTRLARRWVRYTLALPGYCRGLPHPEHGVGNLDASTSQVIGQNIKDDPDGIHFPEALRLP